MSSMGAKYWLQDMLFEIRAASAAVYDWFNGVGRHGGTKRRLLGLFLYWTAVKADQWLWYVKMTLGVRAADIAFKEIWLPYVITFLVLYRIIKKEMMGDGDTGGHISLIIGIIAAVLGISSIGFDLRVWFSPSPNFLLRHGFDADWFIENHPSLVKLIGGQTVATALH